MRSALSSLALLAAAAIPAAAHAATVNFTLNGSNGDVITFAVPSSPTPTFSSTQFGYFDLAGIAVSDKLAGTTTTTTAANPLYFYTAAFSGGLEDDTYALEAFGPLPLTAASQLFTGPVTAPVFSALSSFTLQDQINGVVYTGNAVASSVPEPSSLLLLGTGALGFAGAVRRRFV